MSTAAPTVCCSYASFFALGSSYAKRKDPPVSRRQVFLRSEHLRSAQDPIRLYRSNVINAVQYVLLYASRTGRQLCFAATQQKVSPVGSIPFAGRVFPAHFASRIRPFHFSFRHSPNVCVYDTLLDFPTQTPPFPETYRMQPDLQYQRR